MAIIVSHKKDKKTVFLLGLSSDIGRELAIRYARNGFFVIGTCRDTKQICRFNDIDGIYPIPCDLSNEQSIMSSIETYSSLNKPWDIFISSIGTMNPIGKFMDISFSDWEQSIGINALKQLSFLHALYPYRMKDSMSHAAFFAGGGTNNPFTNYSAYCVSKIFLIKMCELLDDEIPDMNPFIIGPGFVRTKIHDETLSQIHAAGANYEKTQMFLHSDEPGTTHDEIYDCINWCIKQGKPVVGGRNISLVHDPWRENRGEILKSQLITDIDKYKLRRSGNTD